MTEPTGVWMVYYDDYGPRFESMHTDIVEAVRIVSQRGYGKVGWLPFGMELAEAVTAWEDWKPDVKVEWKDPSPQSAADVAEALQKIRKHI